MTNPYKWLWEESDRRSNLYASALGTAKGYLMVIKNNPELAEKWATEGIEKLEEYSTEIYKPTEDANL